MAWSLHYVFIVASLVSTDLPSAKAQTSGEPFPVGPARWVKGTKGQSCDEACAIRTHGTYGCTGAEWPSSLSEFKKVIKKMGNDDCASFDGKKRAESPSVSINENETSVCFWDSPYLAAGSDRSWRCARTHPDFARFCPCQPHQHLTTSTTTPAPKVPALWTLGDRGASCKEACKEGCMDDQWPDSLASFKGILKKMDLMKKCDSVGIEKWAENPAYFGKGACNWEAPHNNSNLRCEIKDRRLARFCPCKPLSKSRRRRRAAGRRRASGDGTRRRSKRRRR